MILLPRITVLCLALCSAAALAADRHAHLAALASIQADEAMAHVEVLAADAMEGRRSASRGGQAAAAYVVNQLRQFGWRGGGPQDEYYQPFPNGGRNILAVREGTDPRLRSQHVILGAHYDHVGYGDSRTSFGPIGAIHNGADDNASGVAALLEFAEAVAQHQIDTRRSLLVAFWDAEELGLLGSQHWCNQPTVPLADVPLVINLDMVGRMRDGRLQVIGSRTGVGARRLASVAVDEGLWIDFTWKLEENSDHWTFLRRGVPALMLHTGLHDNYHRPSDDVATINPAGVSLASRYLFDLAVTAANAATLPAFRQRGMQETPRLQKHRERPLPPLPPAAPRPRVGISWREDDAEPGVVYLTRVAPGSPADAAGLRLYDRLRQIEGEGFADARQFEQRLQQLLTQDAAQIRLQVERDGRLQTISLPLAGAVSQGEG